MSWRRNAGYRTIIIGFGYFTLLISLVAFNRAMPFNVRVFIAAVLALGACFGASYLASNYYKYTAALKRMVLVEEHMGAYAPAYLGPLGALLDERRKRAPEIPLSRNAICIGSILAFLAGGLLTAGAILMM